jgi:uncharacterized delta-60 repeat protein
MRKTMLLGTALVLVQIPLIALVLSQERTWGGLAEDEAAGVAVALDGSVYATGTTSSFGVGGNDAFLLKYAPDGSLAWQRCYGTTPSPINSGHEFGAGVAVGSDGSVYMTGQYTEGNLFLLKFDPAGNLLFQRTWGGNGVGPAGVAIAADNSVYVAGVTFLSGQGQADALLVRFTPDGDVVWAQSWGGPFFDGVSDLAVGADGGIYITGDTNSFSGEDAFLVKFAPDGAVLWDRTWRAVAPSGSGFSFGFGVGTSSDGSVYITGLAGGLPRDESVFLVKFNANGTLVWNVLSGPAFGHGEDVVAAPDGHVYVTGAASDSSSSSNAFVLKFLASGKAREARTWGGTGEESGESIAVAPDGSIAVAGIASAPPYALSRVAQRTVKPASVLDVPAGVVSVASGAVGFPVGIVTTPIGFETFAGATDAAFLRLQP